MQLIIKSFFSILLSLVFGACAEGELPGGSGGQGNTADSGSNAQILCNDDSQCPSGLICQAGICAMAAVNEDAGVAGDAAMVEPRARLEVCTVEGCTPPHRLDFGGSRFGLSVQRTLRIKSVGDKPVTVRSIDILNEGTPTSS